jgi:hypothetical protein
MLALGAIANGSKGGLRGVLQRLAPDIMVLLLEETRVPQPNVRCHACWAVGRITAFLVHLPQAIHAASRFCSDQALLCASRFPPPSSSWPM